MSEKLYQIKRGPDQAFWIDPFGEPQELYAFQVSSLPDDLAEEAEAARLAGAPFGIDDLIERGVTSIYWRQTPKQLLQRAPAMTTDVFEPLTALTEGRIAPGEQFEVLYHDSQTYQLVRMQLDAWAEDPLYFSADLSRTSELQDLVDDRTERGLWRRLSNLRDDEVTTTVWLPSSLLAQPQAMRLAMAGPNNVLVNAKFVDAWRQTEISQHLREQPWEYDLHFEPFEIRGHEYRFFEG